MTIPPRTPAQLADDAAEAVRSFNHATQSLHDGWQHPGDAYGAAAGFAWLAGGLVQALSQLESLVGTLEDTGHLTSDRGPADLPDRLIDFHSAMKEAIADSLELHRALARAHQALGPIAYREGVADPSEA